MSAGRWAVAALVLGIAQLPIRAAADLQVPSTGDSRQVASSRIDGCEAALEWRAAEPALVRYRNDCEQAVADKAQLLASMLHEFAPDPAARAGLQTLFVGRMVLTFPELAQRVALAAARRSDWEPARVWRDVHYANRFYVQVGGQPWLFPELQTALAPLGYSVSLTTAEKVLAGRPRETPFEGWLLAQGVGPRERVPFDAMVWFRLEYRGTGDGAAER